MYWGLVLLLAVQGCTQKPSCGHDYREIFGTEYEYAVSTIGQSSWPDSLARHGIDPAFALAIVFPELIRYSSISDYIEVKAIEVLYVRYGKDYADFSIGHFQMKPAFAEHIEADILQYRLEDHHPELSHLHPSVVDSIGIRKERIIRLQDEKYQLLYLEAFIRIMDKLYPGLGKATPAEKLSFYSAAYNCGYEKGDKVIKWNGDKGYFYLGMDITGQKYVYSEISLDYYLKELE